MLAVSEPVFRHRLSAARARMIESYAGLCQLINMTGVCWQCKGLQEFAGAGRLGIACTMVDHEGSELASIHRELAANVPGNGFDSWRPGAASDRNAILLVRAPFSLAG